jgi:hypothetical protein
MAFMLVFRSVTSVCRSRNRRPFPEKENDMRRIALTLALLLMSFVVSLTRPQTDTKDIQLSEVSGAVNIGDDRVLLVGDEGYQVQVVSRADATFKAGDAKSFAANMKPSSPKTDGRKELVDDLEDAAWDRKRQAAFVITSHSRSKQQDNVTDPKADKPLRHKIARIFLKAGVADSTLEIDVLEEALKKFPFVVEAMKQPHQNGGNTGTFNIEGLAFDEKSDSLLIALRSPTQACKDKSCAVVLTLKNPHEVFDNQSALPKFDPQPRLLDLGGQGIRGMTYDAQKTGVWIIAGRSADPDTPTDEVLPTLWFWNTTQPDTPPRKAKTDSLKLAGLNLESVCLLNRDGKPGLLLISDDGKNKPSRYLWTPIHEL